MTHPITYETIHNQRIAELRGEAERVRRARVATRNAKGEASRPKGFRLVIRQLKSA